MNKKFRFEVFKRDGFKCGYCGKCPPEVMLEIDHIEPKSRGGKNDINNYLTACFDCNRGKGSVPLDKIPLKVAENLEVLKEQESQLIAFRRFIKKIELRENEDIEDINRIYSMHYKKVELSDGFKNVSLRRFLRLLPKHTIIEALGLAINKFPRSKEQVIRYFCGICWNKIKDKNEST